MNDIYNSDNRYDNDGNIVNPIDADTAVHSDVKTEIPDIIDEAYIVRQINKIMNDTAYIRNALVALEQIDLSADKSHMGAGAQAKAQAIQGVVSSREKTHQQMLSMLDKMYDRLHFVHPTPFAESSNSKSEMIKNFNATCETLRKVTDADGNIPDEILETIRDISHKLFS